MTASRGSDAGRRSADRCFASEREHGSSEELVMVEMVLVIVFAAMFLGPCVVATRAQGVEESEAD